MEHLYAGLAHSVKDNALGPLQEVRSTASPRRQDDCLPCLCARPIRAANNLAGDLSGRALGEALRGCPGSDYKS
jgi:hypothetical protein